MLDTMKFTEIVDQMQPLLDQLLGGTAYHGNTLQDLHVRHGIYAFFDREKPMYVGRVGPTSKQPMRARIRNHRSGEPRTAPLPAWMVRRHLGQNDITAKKIAEDHRPIFDQMQERVREMEVRVVEVEDCTIQAVFEIYSALVLQTPFNDFCTH